MARLTDDAATRMWLEGYYTKLFLRIIKNGKRISEVANDGDDGSNEADSASPAAPFQSTSAALANSADAARSSSPRRNNEKLARAIARSKQTH